jgi:methionine sulfoxide reductase heme-binding subunit
MADPGTPWVRVGRVLSGWRLFALLAFLVTLAIVSRLHSVDLHTKQGLLTLIHRSVRSALPLFVVAFSASSLAQLFPGRATRWLLANRRYVGLAFAYGMAWHFGFILWLVSRGDSGLSIFSLGIELDLIGAAFLTAMTITSFPRLVPWLTARGWRRLHKTGAYVIWAVAVNIYASGLSHLHGIKEWAPLAGLLAAFLLRVTAWIRGRLPRRAAGSPTAGAASR